MIGRLFSWCVRDTRLLLSFLRVLGVETGRARDSLDWSTRSAMGAWRESGP